jgi:hypothetical protein
MGQRFTLIACTLVTACCVSACSATRNADGSLTVEFAPDMAIIAYGLEDVAGQLADVLECCFDGTFGPMPLGSRIAWVTLPGDPKQTPWSRRSTATSTAFARMRQWQLLK